ncbi:glycoside hydrolase family 99-like domain-containing protein [Phycisphaeraceae bacterium D3-23]
MSVSGQASVREAVDEDGAAAKPVDLLAYYYPWFDAGDWSRHPYVGTPVLGEYGTDDTATAEQHITWCTEAGIDGLCVSWWGEDSQTDRHLQSGLLSAANVDDIAFCIYYESLKLDPLDGERDTSVDFDHPAVMEQFIADFQYLSATYFERDNYYTIDGRPVVGLYVTRVFVNFTAEHAVRLREAVGADVFLIGDEVYYGPQDSPETARHGPGVFDAVSAYNMHTDPRIEDGEPAWGYMQREAWPVYRRWADDERVWFMPKVMPSYEDFRGHDTLAGSTEGFEAMLTAAGEMAAGDPAGSRGVVFMTSFNEWWEGTTIEPAQEYGTGYLDAISRWRDASR